MPNDPGIRTAKAQIYQAQGNLPEAARLLSEIDWQSPNDQNFIVKITQLRLERNYGEAIRLVEARLAQFHFDSQYDKGREQMRLAWIQRFAGDTAGAKATAEQARNAFEQPYKDQSANAQSPRTLAHLAARLSKVYALIQEKDLAIKTAERAIMLWPSAEDRVVGPAFEENLAVIHTMFGEDNRAISAIAQLLQTPYDSSWYGPPHYAGPS